jgi:hypothetical protein
VEMMPVNGCRGAAALGADCITARGKSGRPEKEQLGGAGGSARGMATWQMRRLRALLTVAPRSGTDLHPSDSRPALLPRGRARSHTGAAFVSPVVEIGPSAPALARAGDGPRAAILAPLRCSRIQAHRGGEGIPRLG